MQIFFKVIIISSVVLGGFFALEANAQATTQTFSIGKEYDLYGRKEIEADLIRTANSAYFYVEQSWWSSLSSEEENTARIAIFELSQEFENRIYPVLTRTFGSEPKPGIDGDERITILIHPMGGEAGGYFNSGDVYSKFQNPKSNEREMLYLNSSSIAKPEAKSFLAHEFVHLITVQQKDLLRHVAEETWLNEARAEYAATLLGYDNIYQGSNLQTRVRNFLANPSNSLVEWLNRKEDYGSVNMFSQYVVDHYGIQVLVDSLQSSSVGMSSLEGALARSGFQKSADQIFSDWSIAVLVNDCSLGEQYCYLNAHLEDVRITPIFYYIPRAETIFSTYHTVSPWSGNWHRFAGGGQNLTLEFNGADSGGSSIPYVLCDTTDACFVESLALDGEKKGRITFSEFDTVYNSLTIIPFAASNNGEGNSFPFSWQITVEKDAATKGDGVLIGQLLARITELQEQVRQLQVQLALGRGQSTISSSQKPKVSCTKFNNNLSFGMKNEQVRCLQEFLSVQDAAIYPEKLVTSNFLSLTRQAVVRFQEKYASEVLTPLKLERGTGYVGQMTRKKINQILGA